MITNGHTHVYCSATVLKCDVFTKLKMPNVNWPNQRYFAKVGLTYIMTELTKEGRKEIDSADEHENRDKTIEKLHVNK